MEGRKEEMEDLPKKAKKRSTLLVKFTLAVTMVFVIQLHVVSASSIQAKSYFSVIVNGNSSTTHDMFVSDQPVGKGDRSLHTRHVSDSFVHSKSIQAIIDNVQSELDKIMTVFTEYQTQRFKRLASPSQNRSFVPPNINNRIKLFEDTVKKLREEVAAAKQMLSPNSTERIRLASTEASLEALQKVVDDLKKEGDQKNNDQDDSVERVIEIVKKLENDLNNIKKSIEEQERLKKQKELPQECILAIKKRTSGSFTTAEKIITDLIDKSMINFIIQEVYNDKQANFELVLAFGEHLKDPTICYLVFTALQYEMQSSGHNDPLKMIRLADSIKKKNIHQLTDGDQTKINAIALVKKLESSVKSVTIEKLKTALLSSHYFPSHEIKTLSEKVFLYSNDLYDDIWTELVHQIYWEQNRKPLLDKIKSLMDGQQVLALGAVYKKMNRIGIDRISQDFIMFAYEIKQILKNKYISSNWKAKLQAMVNDFPKSLKNAIFATRVCIINHVHKEYMYAASHAWFDLERRFIFTFAPASSALADSQAHWKLEKCNEYDFCIRNINYWEYLYSPHDFYKYDHVRRYAFTWMPNTWAGDEGKWRFESDGDNVHIKNLYRSEYLYAAHDRYKYDSQRRRVFTWVEGDKVGQGEWFIEDCS